jgi:carboxypeptidase C (cathepsin A)
LLSHSIKGSISISLTKYFLISTCPGLKAAAMHGLKLSRLLCIFLLAFAFFAARAEEAPPNPHAAQAKPIGGDPASHLPPDSVTQHTITLGGQQLTYKAMAGTLPLFGAKGEIAAKIFYVSYVLDNAPARPVTFAFNGGPGASAAFLHMGAIGPRVVPFTENGAEPVLPVQLTDNADSWLAFTDLVFVDPVGTGYSRAATGGEDGEHAFWGVDKDADSITEFVNLYLARNGRELAPVYLAGESYGGFRAALLSDRLLADGVQVKGAIMISPALEFSMIRDGDLTLLPLTFALPSITAAHIEMRDGPKAPLDAVREAETYARTNYLVHMAEGLKRDDAVIAKLAEFSGLDASVVGKHHGRVSASLFIREYERRKDRALSRYDATVSVPVPQPEDHPHYDPILDGAIAALRPAVVNYLRKELGFRTDLEYRLLNREVNGHWDFGTKPTRQGYAGSLDDLEKARIRNGQLKIFIAHGYTDLVTPYAMSQYLVSQLKPIEGAVPIDVRIYRGGHMMYLRPASRADLTRDARDVYRAEDHK